MFVIDAAELDWSYILQFWDPNQHFGERMTENLNQTLHTDYGHCQDSSPGRVPVGPSSE